MAHWPFFGRKNSRRKSKGVADRSPSPELGKNRTGLQQDVAPPQGSQEGDRRKSEKGGRSNRVSPQRETKKLQRRAMSFSPGRNDTIRVPKDIHRQYPVPPIPQAHRRSTEDVASSDQNDWQRVPTLHKRSRNSSPRRKSSKKRKEDHDRAAEVKAMATIPTRAATEYGVAGRPMKKDSKKMKGGLGRFTNRTSEVSLPVPESIHSSMSSEAEKKALYRLNSMGFMAPRPTIRYTENPRYAPGQSGWGSDDECKKRKIMNGSPIPEEIIRSNKRIEDLADDLDAGDLRELMERDQRRRDRKKITDQEKMERKLTRRAQKQKAAEEEAVRNGTPPPKNMERGVLGRDLIGLGIDADPVTSTRSASEASAKRNQSRSSEVEPTVEAELPSSPQKPASNFEISDSLPASEGASPIDEREEPIIATAQLARLSRASMSPPSSPKGHKRGASSISQIIELSNTSTPPPPAPAIPVMQEQPVKPQPNRTSTESSSGKGKNSWTSFFRRGSKSKRNSIPSSFSNTSRESTVAASSMPYAYTAKRSSASSNTPKRTMSKFREDLPESRYPISPPDSRVQSPETDMVLPLQTNIEQNARRQRSIETPSPFGGASNTRYDTPTSEYRSLEVSRQRAASPIAIQRPDLSIEPTGATAQSLASIDSEGSWLSGRPRAGSKRGSAQMVPRSFRESESSLHNRYNEFDESAEELGIAEDEYFGRLTPAPDDFNAMSRRRASGNPMPSSDEEDGGSLGTPGEGSKWGAVGRHATVVQSESRAKSREGIFNYLDDDSDVESPAYTSGDSKRGSGQTFGETNKIDEPTLARATSVNVGKGHVRHVSAGSARLLDVKARRSGESKRASMEPPKRSGENLNAIDGTEA